MADDIGSFLVALRQQESGGNYTARNASGASGAYQFMPGTWANYKGYGSAADAPPAIQDEKARQLAQSYYDRFGNWGDVAKAWYAGPGFATKNQTAPQGQYPSINTYASQVVSKMGQPATGSVQTVTTQAAATGTQQTALPGIDPKLPIEDQITALAYSQHGAVLAPFINDPEIRAILRRYVNREIDEATMNGLVQQTTVWRNTTQAQRTFDALEAGDPATAKAEVQAERDRIATLVGTLGYAMTDADIDFLARKSKRDGLTDLQIQQSIIGHFALTGGGKAGDAYAQVNDLLNQWMVSVDDTTKQQWTTDMMMGRLTSETLTAHLRNVNASQYPGMAAALQANPSITPLQYVAPIRQTIASELGSNPNDIDFANNPNYKRFLQFYDPQAKTYRTMNDAEITQTIRSDAAYGWKYTQNGMNARTDFALNLAQAMGRRPG